MSKVFIDANVIIYSRDSTAIYHRESQLIIKQIVQLKLQGVVSPWVINEVHYQMIKTIGYEKAAKRINDIFISPDIKLVDIALTLLDLKAIMRMSLKHHLKTFDAFHAYYCKKMKIKYIATFDSDFKRLPWLKLFKTPITTPLSN